MEKILFAKYNRNRKDKFQLSTMICESENKKYVKKTALNELAKSHIVAMESYYEDLKKIYKNISFVPVTVGEDFACFNFIKGKSLKGIILGKLESDSKENFLEYFSKITEYCFEKIETSTQFKITDEFIEVFGKAELDCKASCQNLDMIFENILVDDDKYTCIDYEWFFDFQIPDEFVKYRSIYYFYINNKKILSDKNISLDELCNCVNIAESNINTFAEMEENFQKWVVGDSNYTSRYECEVFYDSVAELKNKNDEFSSHLDRLNTEISTKDKRIDELQGEHEKDVSEMQKNWKKIDELNEEKNELLQKNEVCEYNLNKANSAIHDKDVHIINLESQINFLNQQISMKDNHIANLEYLHNRWKRYVPSSVRKAVKLPVRAARKVKRMAANKKNTAYNKLIVPACSNPLVSIIIPVYNQFNYTYECVKSIIEHTQDVKYEIIIGDDVSTDETKNISRYIKGVKVVRNSENLRFLLNCNNAAKHAKGKYIFFLNNDTKVTEGWLYSLVELIESDNTIGMVGSKLIYPDGRLQEAGGIIWKDASAWNYGNGQDPEQPEFNYVRDVDYISGAAIMLSKELWNKIGGFDEEFAPAYCEDSDLAFQVRQQGYRVVYQPASVVVHFEGVSNGTDTSTGLKHYQIVNNEKLKTKWAEELSKHYENGQNVLKAKDRCFDDGKTILFIDHYVPQFDKDAGSRTVFQYVKMFVKKGYKVKFIGDNFFKHEPYTTVLNKMGVEVLHGPWYAQHIFEWLKDNNDCIDYVFMNRPHISEKYMDFFNENMKAKVIYYGHDLHFLRINREYELTGDEEKRLEAASWKAKELDLMHKADVVYYPSYVEADLIKQVDNTINVKALVPYVYDEFKSKKRNSVYNKGILFVGGFSHTPNVDAVNWFVKEVYSEIKDKADIPFYIAGSNPPEEILAYDGDGIEVKGFVSDEELERLYSSCKLVVVPLRYGAGVKGKVVEAIYNGVPIVTTNVGAEGIPATDNILVIKDDAKEFADAVISLYNDAKKLDEISDNMQKYIKENNSIDAAWNIVGEDFN